MPRSCREWNNRSFATHSHYCKLVPVSSRMDGAASILAEIGPNMAQFPTEAHLSSWAGVCPGNNCTGGKAKPAKIPRGNRWLPTTLVECAWAASKKKNCFLKVRFWRLAARGKKRALVAIAHTIL